MRHSRAVRRRRLRLQWKSRAAGKLVSAGPWNYGAGIGWVGVEIRKSGTASVSYSDQVRDHWSIVVAVVLSVLTLALFVAAVFPH
jgi:purine-cytosine permease-like protein